MRNYKKDVVKAQSVKESLEIKTRMTSFRMAYDTVGFVKKKNLNSGRRLI